MLDQCKKCRWFCHLVLFAKACKGQVPLDQFWLFLVVLRVSPQFGSLHVGSDWPNCTWTGCAGQAAWHPEPRVLGGELFVSNQYSSWKVILIEATSCQLHARVSLEDSAEQIAWLGNFLDRCGSLRHWRESSPLVLEWVGR